MISPLKVEKLKRIFNSAEFSLKKIDGTSLPQEIIGQERAVKALNFGLGFKAHGFNIYVSGYPGTGKYTAIQRFLEKLAKREKTPQDWCFVNNFKDAYHPKMLKLPAGKGKILKKEISELIDDSKQILNSTFESDEYHSKREEILNKYKTQKNGSFNTLEKQAGKEGFVIKHTPVAIYATPVRKGKPMTDHEFENLPKSEQDEIIKKQDTLQERLNGYLRISRKLDKKANSELAELEKRVALYAIFPLIDEMKEEYQGLDEVVQYLDELKDDILENLPAFLGSKAPVENLSKLFSAVDESHFKNYEVNVLIDNSETKGAPVIIERNPTFHQLFGSIEKETQLGALVTHFTLIRPGSLHLANGGYLIIPVRELLTNIFAWESLKRALRDKEIITEDISDKMGFLSTKTLKPESVPLDVQVILVGEPILYFLLYQYDSDFKELFKVKADFDTTMDRNKKNLKAFTSLLASVVTEEKIVSLHESAYGKIIEHASRIADDQDKISTRFGEIVDYVKEAGYYAMENNSRQIRDTHFQKAIEEKFYRSSMIRDRINQMIRDKVILIDLKGKKVGQLNGISVLHLGDILFGRPNRITATVGVGRKGVIDIEREAKLAGPIHTKGVMILSGYLTNKFGHNKPLSLTASLVFEQSYGEIEGDSASSAELYTLLSSLSGLPLEQDIAVTGSVNQQGEVQAVGGINEKIEGFFEVCKTNGLTGNQGVIIPAGNLKNLMLKDQVIQAVKAKKFRVWAVKTIDEGIEILTGVPAGKNLKNGFQKNTVNYNVDQRIRELNNYLVGQDNKEEK